MKRLEAIWVHLGATLICKCPILISAAILTWTDGKWLAFSGFYFVILFLFGFRLFTKLGKALSSRFTLRSQPREIHRTSNAIRGDKKLWRYYADKASFWIAYLDKGFVVLIAAAFTWAVSKWLPLDSFYFVVTFLFWFWLFNQIGKALSSYFMFRYYIQPKKGYALRSIDRNYKNIRGHSSDRARFWAAFMRKSLAIPVAAILTWIVVKWPDLDSFYFIVIFLFWFGLFNHITKKYASRLMFRYHIQPWKIYIINNINKEYKRFCEHYPDITTPKTYSEKIQWYKLHYRNSLMPVLADKYRVRKYLADKGYGDLLVHQYLAVDSFDQLNFNTMPRAFVVKLTHNYGGVFIVRDKSSYDFDTMKEKINYQIKYPYSIDVGEWHYLFIKPRIIVEEYLEDEPGKLKDYKVHCFANKAKYIQVVYNRFGNLQQTFFDRDWNNCYFNYHWDAPLMQTTTKPKILPQMLALAEELSHPFPYIRIDFYCINDKLYFGEFTFFPGAGKPYFNPPMWDLTLGQYFPEFR